MPTIGAAVPVEIKDKFEAVAEEKRVTASRLAASLIMEFLLQELGASPQDSHVRSHKSVDVASSRCGPRTEQVFVRLSPYYFAELGRLANERNWYRGTYLSSLVHAHVDRRPVLCEAEINAVRQVARQLADVGRNINQIARKISVSESALLDNALDFQLIKMLIELETNVVKDLLKANLQGWGVTDAKT